MPTAAAGCLSLSWTFKPFCSSLKALTVSSRKFGPFYLITYYKNGSKKLLDIQYNEFLHYNICGTFFLLDAVSGAQAPALIPRAY